MVGSAQVDHAIDTVQEVWKINPHRNVRVPSITANNNPIPVDALWTDKGLRPNFNNLAFVIQHCRDIEELVRWKKQLASLPIRGWLLVADDRYRLQYYDQFNQLEEERIRPDDLASTLNSSKSHLFTPKALAEFRSGQLSLADLEESVSERSFDFITRQRQQLDEAFKNGINTALNQISIVTTPQEYFRHQIEGHTIRVAIAFLAARILEDKGFFGSDSLTPTNDPRKLLKRTVSYTNGFFKKASDSISWLEEYVREQETDRILQSLAANLGDRVTFALVDHRDVGLFYERAIRELPHDLGGQDWNDLQRHYTPVAIAERMLELLPLERLRPEERVIFDPAAGSGSLLLAATSRLAGMKDIPDEINARENYLAHHVAGNDLDEYADLVTKLRYLLAKESLGDNVPFPFPDYFSHQDYEQLNKDNMEIKPRVVVANPPFAEDGNTQRAVVFIEKALSWLDEGSQFAFVLPQSFLTNKTHGVPKVRKLLSENSQIFEVWQLPAGNIGLDAKQDACILLGSIGKFKKIFPTTSRAIFAQGKNSDTRENGFLGNTWISKLDSSNEVWSNEVWSSVITPEIKIQISTVPLGNLFYVFNGVNPGRYGKIYPPVKECPEGIECKLNWALQYRDLDRLWANPERVPIEKRWRQYGAEYLERPRLKNSSLFDMPKLLVGRKVNRGSVNPIAIQLDLKGFCPDSDVYCLLPVNQTGKYSRSYKYTDDCPEEWQNLSHENQRLWLLGLLSSNICNELSLHGRNTREINVLSLCNLPLPAKVDQRIIEITRQIVERDQQNLPIPEPDELRIKLDKIVKESYGNPQWIEISRTGTPTGLEEWKQERTKPTITVIGQVLEVSEDNSRIFVYLNGLVDEEEEQWLSILPEMPGWTLDGTVFEAELSEDVETFAELAQRPWAIRRFRHTPRPYLTNEELKAKLGV